MAVPPDKSFLKDDSTLSFSKPPTCSSTTIREVCRSRVREYLGLYPRLGTDDTLNTATDPRSSWSKLELATGDHSWGHVSKLTNDVDAAEVIRSLEQKLSLATTDTSSLGILSVDRMTDLTGSLLDAETSAVPKREHAERQPTTDVSKDTMTLASNLALKNSAGSEAVTYPDVHSESCNTIEKSDSTIKVAVPESLTTDDARSTPGVARTSVNPSSGSRHLASGSTSLSIESPDVYASRTTEPMTDLSSFNMDEVCKSWEEVPALPKKFSEKTEVPTKSSTTADFREEEFSARSSSLGACRRAFSETIADKNNQGSSVFGRENLHYADCDKPPLSNMEFPGACPFPDSDFQVSVSEIFMSGDDAKKLLQVEEANFKKDQLTINTNDRISECDSWMPFSENADVTRPSWLDEARCSVKERINISELIRKRTENLRKPSFGMNTTERSSVLASSRLSQIKEEDYRVLDLSPTSRSSRRPKSDALVCQGTTQFTDDTCSPNGRAISLMIAEASLSDDYVALAAKLHKIYQNKLNRQPGSKPTKQHSDLIANFACRSGIENVHSEQQTEVGHCNPAVQEPVPSQPAVRSRTGSPAGLSKSSNHPSFSSNSTLLEEETLHSSHGNQKTANLPSDSGSNINILGAKTVHSPSNHYKCDNRHVASDHIIKELHSPRQAHAMLQSDCRPLGEHYAHVMAFPSCSQCIRQPSPTSSLSVNIPSAPFADPSGRVWTSSQQSQGSAPGCVMCFPSAMRTPETLVGMTSPYLSASWWNPGAVMECLQVHLPPLVRIPKPVCVGDTEDIVVPVVNPYKCALQFSLQLESVSLDGHCGSPLDSTFSIPQSISVYPESTEHIKVSFRPKLPGNHAGTFSLRPLLPADRVLDCNKGFTVIADVRRASIKVTKLMDFGEIPEASTTYHTLEIINKCGTAIPARIIVTDGGEAQVNHSWSFAIQEMHEQNPKASPKDWCFLSATAMLCRITGGAESVFSVPLQFSAGKLFDSANLEVMGILTVMLESATISEILASIKLIAKVGKVTLSISPEGPIMLHCHSGESTSCKLHVRNHGTIEAEAKLTCTGGPNIQVVPSDVKVAPKGKSSVSVVFHAPDRQGWSSQESTLQVRVHSIKEVSDLARIKVQEVMPVGSSLLAKFCSNQHLSNKHPLCITHTDLDLEQFQPTKYSKVVSRGSNMETIQLQMSRNFVAWGGIDIGHTTRKVLLLKNTSSDVIIKVTLNLKDQTSSFAILVIQQNIECLESTLELVIGPQQERAVTLTFTPRAKQSYKTELVVRPVSLLCGNADDIPVPLHGYGGVSRVQIVTPTVEDQRLNSNAYTTEKNQHIILCNVGVRAAFVKVMLLPDLKSLPEGNPPVFAHPSELIMLEGEIKHVSIKPNQNESVAYLLYVFSGDELLRNRFRRGIGHYQITQDSVDLLSGINFNALFVGEDRVEDDPAYPSCISDGQLFYEGIHCQIFKWPDDFHCHPVGTRTEPVAFGLASSSANLLAIDLNQDFYRKLASASPPVREAPASQQLTAAGDRVLTGVVRSIPMPSAGIIPSPVLGTSGNEVKHWLPLKINPEMFCLAKDSGRVTIRVKNCSTIDQWCLVDWPVDILTISPSSYCLAPQEEFQLTLMLQCNWSGSLARWYGTISGRETGSQQITCIIRQVSRAEYKMYTRMTDLEPPERETCDHISEAKCVPQLADEESQASSVGLYSTKRVSDIRESKVPFVALTLPVNKYNSSALCTSSGSIGDQTTNREKVYCSLVNINFLPLACSETSSQIVRVCNVGSEACKVSIEALPAPFRMKRTSFTVSSNTYVGLNIYFEPTQPGSFEHTVILCIDNGQTLKINLTGGAFEPLCLPNSTKK